MLCWALFTILITSPWPAFHVAAGRNEGSRHAETVREARQLSDEGPQQQIAAGVGSQHRGPAAAAVGGSQWPVASRLDPWTKSFDRRYFRFHDVQLHPNKLVFFRSEEDTEAPPETLLLNKLVAGVTMELQVQMGNAAHRHHDISACNGWITQPTVLIAGTPYAKNLWDYVSAFMPVWDTAHQEGLLKVDRYLTASMPPSSEEAGLNLIHAYNDTYDSYWGYWMDYLSPNQWSLDQVSGQCFTDITVAESSILQFVLMNNTAAYIAPQQQALKAFQRWIFRVEAVHWRSQGVSPPELLVDSVPYKRPRVVLAARPAANHWGVPSRGMVNEEEVLGFIAANFDVNVTRIMFGGRMEEAMSVMQQTDMLIGLHGAALTHVLWMRPESHMLQLIPYGWVIHPHWNPASSWLIRGKQFKQVARAVGASYSQWENQDPDNAFFHKSHFVERPEDFQEHPTPEMPLPRDWNASQFWIHQSTRVGLESFRPVLEQAMAALNVPVRPSVSLASDR